MTVARVCLIFANGFNYHELTFVNRLGHAPVGQFVLSDSTLILFYHYLSFFNLWRHYFPYRRRWSFCEYILVLRFYGMTVARVIFDFCYRLNSPVY